MAPRIVIVDYGMANLRSVQKAFEKVGHAAEISGDPNRVGRGRQARAARRRRLPRRHRPAARDRPGSSRSCEHVRAGKPFLGICLGLQLLFTTSYEDGVYNGPRPVPRRGGALRRRARPQGAAHGLEPAPHPPARARIFGDLPAGAAVYFVHSYYVVPTRPER